MKKLRVGIPVKASYHEHAGGAFSYTQQLLEALHQHQWDERIELVFIKFDRGGLSSDFKNREISVHPFMHSSFKDKLRKVAIEFFKLIGLKPALHFLESTHARRRSELIVTELKRSKIDILYYINPEVTITDFPFIVTHWDIGHRSTFPFPELGSSMEYHSRSRYYREVVPLALKIFAETDAGKQELITYQNIFEGKIDVIPLFPGMVVKVEVDEKQQKDLLEKLGLSSGHYLFYPAQFWPHKNHILLLSAMEKLRLKYPELKLVLSGSDKGNLSFIKESILDKQLEREVVQTGFVNQEELNTLYRHAAIMVMPTFLGPSNIPPLEAAFLNCPVLISDLPGHREIMGDYADFFDPCNVEELVIKIEHILENQQAHKREFKGAVKFNIKNSLAEIEKSLLRLQVIRGNWQ